MEKDTTVEEVVSTEIDSSEDETIVEDSLTLITTRTPARIDSLNKIPNSKGVLDNTTDLFSDAQYDDAPNLAPTPSSILSNDKY